MRIKTKTDCIYELTLEDLLFGDVFTFSNSSILRMKTDKVTEEGILCVTIDKGELEGFDGDEIVYRVVGSFVEE